MSESANTLLERTRKPRVHITYDVNIDGAMQVRELPFVVGVLADLSGNPAKPLLPLKERKFVEIHRDNFDEILDGMKPRVAFTAETKDPKTGAVTAVLPVALQFQNMKDFSPEQVALRIPLLRRMVEERQGLSTLLDKMDSNEKIDPVLRNLLVNHEKLKQLCSETGLGEHLEGDEA